MSDQNILDNNDADEHLTHESIFDRPTVNHFPPQNNYYFRFAHAPTKALFVSHDTTNQASPPHGNLILLNDYVSSQDNRFRFRIVSPNNVNPFVSIRPSLSSAGNILALTTSNHGRLVATTQPTPANFMITEVRDGVYNIEKKGHQGFIGLPGAVVTNNAQVFVRPDFTPLEREWIITTNPVSPIPAIKPIEEGIYTINTALKPTSGIEAPLAINEESEPFIYQSDIIVTQLWRFVYNGELNAYQILSNTLRPLLAYDSGISSTPSRQRYRLRFTDSWMQTDATYWRVNPNEFGYFTISSIRFPEQNFDLTQGITANDTPVQLSSSNEYDSQNWLLKRVL